MGQLEEAFRDAAGEVAQIKSRPSNRYWWLYGTIKAKNANGTLDVAIDGVTIQQVKATVSCMTANVGDRVIVLKAGPLMTCVDVIATSDEVKVPASSITGTLPESALPTASTTAKGIMQTGSGLAVSDGIVSVDNGACVRLLWSGMTQSSVTLSAPLAGFRAIAVTIGGIDGVDEGTTLVWSPDGKTFDVTAAFVVGTNNFRVMRMRFSASGSTLTPTVVDGQDSSGYTGLTAYLHSVVGIV